MEPIKMAEIAVKALDRKKASDITAIKIEDITTLADYFVIASASSSTQLKALADEVEYELEQQGVNCHHREGMQSQEWILLDYGDIIVHVFIKDSRAFYNLDKMWSDGEAIDISEWTKPE